MIISRTPYRISFFGGGTDYPAWYRRHGGSVLATTIDKYCYLSCRYLPPFFEHRTRIVYSKIESVQRVEEIGHPAVREIIRYLNLDRGLEIHHDGDLPARSGMGSSSAFSVGLLNALHALQGRMASKPQLAKESIHIEQDLLQENVGSQDQVLAAYGGLNHVQFLSNGEISVRPITIPAERMRELGAHLLLLYTGIIRTASDVANSYVHDLEARRRQLRIMKDLVDEGTSVLTGGQDLTAFGELLHEAWQAKRSMSSRISNGHVDDLYAEARAAGAIGGKLTGAGGGGFLLLFVPPEQQGGVRERLSRFIHVPIRLEFSGSQIIFFEPEADYSAEELVRADQTLQAFRELESAATERVPA
jgi:D-glycero-alpha-D-manno-heptose-7-phosphate kinase